MFVPLTQIQQEVTELTEEDFKAPSLHRNLNAPGSNSDMRQRALTIC